MSMNAICYNKVNECYTSNKVNACYNKVQIMDISAVNSTVKHVVKKTLKRQDELT